MRKVLCLLCMMAASVGFSQSANHFYLKNVDRVVFYGDSITAQRLYTMIAETYVVTRYPQLNVTFVNSGWGGDTVNGGLGGTIDTRLQRDVIAYNPTVITIMLGMNDGGYKAETEDNDEKYFNGYRHIVTTVRSALPQIRITAIEPSPYDDVTGPPAFPVLSNIHYNDVMMSYGKWIANYAKQANLDVADLNTGLVKTLENAKALDPKGAKDIIPGHIHPSFAGHMIMAEELLKAWKARPVVAAVTIDASRQEPRIRLAEHTSISRLSGGNGIQWTELDDALPLPFPQWEAMWGGGAAAGLVIRSSDITAALNEEPLKIEGLKSGVYALRIDSKKIGAFNNDELAGGINLALMETPMTNQAMKVYDLTVSHGDIHDARWRTVQVSLAPYDLPQTKATMEYLDALERTVIEKQHEVAQPTPHRFEVIPLS